MPYVTRGEREALAGTPWAAKPGQLTYVLTEAITRFLLEREAQTGMDNDFADYASVIGALEATKLEFFRRVLAPYEEAKCAQHGDVYR